MIHVRSSREDEAPQVAAWVADPSALKWFPMTDQREIDDAIRIWAGYAKRGASFTAEYDGEIAGMAVLYLQPYQKFSHQCLFAIIVAEKFRGRGVGQALIEHFEKEGPKHFHLEKIHLEVYEGNPAIHLYERLGYKVYGTHPRFIKENGQYICKVLMEKELHGGA